MPDTSVTIIGAGVVGLAIAARLAPTEPDLVILERCTRHGQGTSSRNSEVIHAGMYYPTGSLKAILCVEGNRRTYEICERFKLPHRRIGKLITATNAEELPALDPLLALGLANGVEIASITGEAARRMEPSIRSVGALWSPNTGIVSAHALMDHFLSTARQAGAIFRPHCELVGVERRSDGYSLTVRREKGTESFSTEWVVNASGLESDTVAALAGIDVDAAGYRLHYCKGSYFSVRPGKAGLVSRLVYPVPTHVSLGIHVVVDLEGRLKFGPDVEYRIDRELDYGVDESRREAFAEAVRHLIPAISDADLTPDMSGIRPKLQGPGEAFRDFVIAEESTRSLPGFLNLIGIESPGLTAAPAIADHVARLIHGAPWRHRRS